MRLCGLRRWIWRRHLIHDVLFSAMQDAADICSSDICCLISLYRDMSANVKLEAGLLSRAFAITRGVRQGDPLSPTLFINLLRNIFAPLKESWEQKRYGSIVGSWENGTGRVTHVLFADDTTLLARSRRALQHMLRDIKQAYFAAGLRLNASKCNVQTNTKVPTAVATLHVDDLELPIVSSADGFMVLGTLFTLSGRVSKELKRRTACAWGEFHQIWPLFARRHTCLHRRLRLFDSTVSKTMLWCCESWALTSEEKRMLLTTQRAMLRCFAATRRRPDQDY